MPDIWTHILCGNKTIEDLNNKELYSEILNRINIFKLGTQGPDIFYYYRFWRGFNTKGEKVLGKIMHTNRTGEFLVNCIKYLKSLWSSNQHLELLAYIMGFISHYTLDSITHPYIYYYAFLHSNDNGRTYLINSYHKKLEMIIDKIYLNRNYDLSCSGIFPYKAINVGICVPDIITDCLKSQIKYTYNFNIRNSLINDAYRDMRTGLKLLYDPTNIKLNMVQLLEKILKTPQKYTCAFYPIYLEDDYDYMNDNHNEWKHPYNIHQSYRESFNDLFDKAVQESRKKIHASIGFINGEIDEFDLAAYFPNISYLTGM